MNALKAESILSSIEEQAFDMRNIDFVMFKVGKESFRIEWDLAFSASRPRSVFVAVAVPVEIEEQK